MVLVAIVVGGASGLCAVGFRFLIRLVTDASFAGLPGALGLVRGELPAALVDPVVAAAHLPWYWLLVVPALGGAVAAPLIYYLASEAKGHGVPEVMEAIAVRGGTIRPRVVVVKAVASAFSIGSGGSVGREGPIVQIGSALGSAIGQLLRVPGRQLRTLVGCGAASGIAAAFNAPIAGALFAVEIILGDFAVPQFSPIVISSVVATVVSRAFLGDFPAFVVPKYELVSPFELLPYMVVGVAAGLVAVCFLLVLYASEDFFERLRIPGLLKIPTGGLLIGALGIGLPQIYGVGYSTIDAALGGALPLGLLLLLLVAKVVATSVTLGSGGSGGVFAPSLFLGAMTGGAFGTLIHQLAPDVTASSGAYALVTMGAVVAAATHAPITAIIMIFELTQEIRIIPPLMAACVISTLVSTFLVNDSIYTLKLRRRGIDAFGTEEPNALRTLFVRDVLDRSPEKVKPSTRFAEILDLVVGSDHTAFFVVDDAGHLLGAISLAQLRALIFQRELLHHLVVAADLLDAGCARVTEKDDLDLVVQLMASSGASEIPVVDEAGALVGSVHERDVMEAYNEELLRRDLAGGITARMALAGRAQRVDLGGGAVVAELPAPRSFHGRTLLELDLRRRSGVEVVLVRHRVAAGAASVRFPQAEDRIREGDALVVAGRADAIERLEAL
jgi:CIC family chloride channel protein